MLSALVGLLVLYGLVHIVAILHRKRGELQQLMKGPNKLILTYQDVSFTDQGPWLYRQLPAEVLIWDSYKMVTCSKF